jgi:uncharacterized NAD-dependent epimerase/dehydratase family protein
MLESAANPPPVHEARSKKPTAVVYCEANFGSLDGKTANGLVRHSESYEIVSIIDSKHSGRDSGEVLDNKPNGIPILRNLDESINHSKRVPQTYIFGMAPSSGVLSQTERELVLEAMSYGMNIVNGLHEFLEDDAIFAAMSREKKVTIRDIRRPRPKKDLRLFTGQVNTLPCRRIAVLGTDCAIGKRTTSTILNRALNSIGIKSVMISTGQTGLIQGARYGVALDAVPSQYCAGELEAKIIEAYKIERPQVIVIEGQGALSHPAFSTTSFILRGSCPDGVILQHAPCRTNRCDFVGMKMPEPEQEIELIQSFSDTKVIGIAINHEGMSEAQISSVIKRYEAQFGLPVTDALARPPEDLARMAYTAFPEVQCKEAS